MLVLYHNYGFQTNAIEMSKIWPKSFHANQVNFVNCNVPSEGILDNLSVCMARLNLIFRVQGIHSFASLALP
jgi:hypothetical protein